MAQRKRIRLVTVRLRVLSLASLSGLRIWECHELRCRSQTRLGSVLLWLWCRLAATAPIRPLAWEPPYASGEALEKAKRQKKTTKRVYLKITLNANLLIAT